MAVQAHALAVAELITAANSASDGTRTAKHDDPGKGERRLKYS
jgi:hypothetical protein